MKFFKILIPVATILYWAACAVPQRIPPAEVASLQVKPKDTGAYYYYAESHLMRRHGKFDEAIELLKEAVARDEDSIFLKNELARLYIHQNDYESALGVARDITQRHPEHLPSSVMLGGIYAAMNRHTEAIGAYEKALALDPGYENIYLLLGSEYTKIKQLNRVCCHEPL